MYSQTTLDRVYDHIMDHDVWTIPEFAKYVGWSESYTRNVINYMIRQGEVTALADGMIMYSSLYDCWIDYIDPYYGIQKLMPELIWIMGIEAQYIRAGKPMSELHEGILRDTIRLAQYVV